MISITRALIEEHQLVEDVRAQDNHLYHGQNIGRESEAVTYSGIGNARVIVHYLRQVSMEPWLIEYGTIFRNQTRKDFLLINITVTVLRILVYFIATCNNLIYTYFIYFVLRQ